jgi:hypothetical protein
MMGGFGHAEGQDEGVIAARLEWKNGNIGTNFFGLWAIGSIEEGCCWDD